MNLGTSHITHGTTKEPKAVYKWRGLEDLRVALTNSRANLSLGVASKITISWLVRDAAPERTVDLPSSYATKDTLYGCVV
jgi:hypothetical protein